MNIKQKIKIELITKNIKNNFLAEQLGMSRQLMYHHIARKNPKILSEIEKILNLSEGTLLQE